MSGTIRTWSPPRSGIERLRLFALPGTEVLGEKIARSAVLRGLWRLEPLPWANTINPSAAFGMFMVPARPSGGMATSDDVTDCRPGVACRLMAHLGLHRP